MSTEAGKAAEPGVNPAGADGKGGTQAGADAKATDDSKPMDAAEAKTVRAALQKANEEAKNARLELAKVAADKAAAEKAKAEAEGNVVKLREIEQAERKKLEADLAEAKSKASLADEYGAAITGRVDALAAKLSEDDRKLLAAVPVGQRLALAERLAGGTQPGPAPARTAGAPGQVNPAFDFTGKTPKQIEQFFLSNPKALAEWQASQNKQRNTF